MKKPWKKSVEFFHGAKVLASTTLFIYLHLSHFILLSIILFNCFSAAENCRSTFTPMQVFELPAAMLRMHRIILSVLTPFRLQMHSYILYHIIVTPAGAAFRSFNSNVNYLNWRNHQKSFCLLCIVYLWGDVRSVSLAWFVSDWLKLLRVVLPAYATPSSN